MKKIISSISLLAVVGFTGCSTSLSNSEANKAPVNNAPTNNVVVEQCSIDGKVAPSWVCDGGATMEGGLFAVGSAETSPLGLSFQRKEAAAAARDALSRELKVKVKNMFKQFQATTVVGDAQTAEKATQNVSKQVSANLLSGSKIMKAWVSPKGTLFVLVGMPDPSTVKETVKEAVKTTFHNDKALWHEFKTKKAEAELDAAVG